MSILRNLPLPFLVVPISSHHLLKMKLGFCGLRPLSYPGIMITAPTKSKRFSKLKLNLIEKFTRVSCPHHSDWWDVSPGHGYPVLDISTGHPLKDTCLRISTLGKRYCSVLS